MNNGQVFLDCFEPATCNPSTRSIKAGVGDFTVGDVGVYITFTIGYTVDTNGYDSINQCYSEKSTGNIYYTVLNRTKKI